MGQLRHPLCEFSATEVKRTSWKAQQSNDMSEIDFFRGLERVTLYETRTEYSNSNTTVGATRGWYYVIQILRFVGKGTVELACRIIKAEESRQ